MVLTSLKTLVENVHKAIYADEHTWLIILVLVFLILIPLMLISKRWRKPVVNINDKRRENFEEWRKLVLRFGDFFDKRIRDFFRYKHIDIDKEDWDVSCEIVDRILKIVVSEMRKEAIKRFPGLAIGKTLRKQGSSREGLKVCDPLEFDVLLPFLLENVKTNNDAVFDNNGCIIPGLFKMRIMNPDKLPSWWRKCELVSEERGKTYINTSNFHKKVFASLLDQTREGINKVLKKLTENTNDEYAVVRSVISPSLKITIHVHSENGLKSFTNILGFLEDLYVRGEGFPVYKEIDLEIDLVPGILLSIDEFPKNMLNRNSFISCERYGVMKWVNKKNHHIPKQDGDLIWRNSTCGYEKCIFDIAQKNSSQLYVMTACRLLKWALRKVTSSTNNQLGSVLKSYHLKNLCFYCILFLTIPFERKRLSGVTEATGYFIEFIRLSLEAGNLPHFFHGNPCLSDIFPGSVFGEEKTKYNMFAMNSEETLVQARLGFKDFKRTLDGLYLERDQLDYKIIKLFACHLHLQ
ncbi:uncharacterized protein LOC128166753 isoform X2 [Crassostrea angulata]|nr:uncharacterized protein LOC128166753 isoform X2 [Crassostrea angulata]